MNPAAMEYSNQSAIPFFFLGFRTNDGSALIRGVLISGQDKSFVKWKFDDVKFVVPSLQQACCTST